MNIDRTLFWFKDGDNVLVSFNERFFALGVLLNRFLNENYNGKKIKFINIDFSTEITYQLHPILPKNTAYHYNGHLRFYGIIDLDKFNILIEEKQNHYIWDMAFKYLQVLANSTKNKQLLVSCEYAYNKGLEKALNPDYEMIESEIFLYGYKLTAAVWVNFRKDGMYSILILKKDNKIVFEKEIDKTRNGVEFFLEMYKSISTKANTLIIKGRKDVEYLPLCISIDKEMIIK